MNGYKLVYTAEPTDYFKQIETARESTELAYSLGLTIGKDGNVRAVIWNSPAFRAGIDVGTTIEAVNGEEYSSDRIKAAVVAAKGSKDPIRLLVKDGDNFRDVTIDYHDGPRYPRLQKVGQGETGLDRLLTPR